MSTYRSGESPDKWPQAEWFDVPGRASVADIAQLNHSDASAVWRGVVA